MTQRSKFKSKQAQRYLKYKEAIGWSAKATGAKPHHGPVVVEAIAFISIKEKDMDVDNLAKSFLDGLNAIAWHDDRQVVKLTVEKIYVEDVMEQKAIITIYESMVEVSA